VRLDELKTAAANAERRPRARRISAHSKPTS
jgi:hypothetical protein